MLRRFAPRNDGAGEHAAELTVEDSEGGLDLDSIGSEREQGPSWARANWPVAELDELNAGLDPTLMTIEKVAAKAKEEATAAGKSTADVEQAANDSICAMMLIRTYRVRGHLADRKSVV